MCLSAVPSLQKATRTKRALPTDREQEEEGMRARAKRRERNKKQQR